MSNSAPATTFIDRASKTGVTAVSTVGTRATTSVALNVALRGTVAPRVRRKIGNVTESSVISMDAGATNNFLT